MKQKILHVQDNLPQVRRSIEHAASLYKTIPVPQIGGFRLDISPAKMNPSLIAQLSEETLSAIDECVYVDIVLESTNSGTSISLTSRTPMWYYTDSMFEEDTLYSLASTIENTLAAQRASTKLPTFPAPPQPPTNL